MKSDHRSYRASSSAGFTLIELLVALMLISIVTAIAVPRTMEYADSFNRFNTRSWMLHDLRRLQALALNEGCRGILSIATDGGSYSIGCDYLDYNTSTAPTPDVVQFTRSFPIGFTLSASAPIIFSSRGQAIDQFGILNNVTVTLVDSTGGTGVTYGVGTLHASGFFSFS